MPACAACCLCTWLTVYLPDCPTACSRVPCPPALCDVLVLLRAADCLLRGYDNNDGDVCCADQDAAEKHGHGRSPYGWLVWGASTQGAACGITDADGTKTCSTNAVGRFNATEMSLGELMDSYFK